MHASPREGFTTGPPCPADFDPLPWLAQKNYLLPHPVPKQKKLPRTSVDHNHFQQFRHIVIIFNQFKDYNILTGMSQILSNIITYLQRSDPEKATLLSVLQHSHQVILISYCCSIEIIHNLFGSQSLGATNCKIDCVFTVDAVQLFSFQLKKTFHLLTKMFKRNCFKLIVFCISEVWIIWRRKDTTSWYLF